ncbi:hypothetical protein FGO68_gene9741 [Halteria grandinella]|uniref:Amino acid transporter transmembrane domain-containing protein n=1 Tax=Halteria grandinella TaxID=5974 RepID=A0A8J8NSS8_HALGN|nr:hypothetical protein FGO68_gene9741 [Halteria grandinella]
MDHKENGKKPAFNAGANNTSESLLGKNNYINMTEDLRKSSNTSSNILQDQRHNSEMPSDMALSPKSRRNFADLMLSPVRFTQRKFRAGGTSGSIFSLVAATLGAGTLTFGYAIKENGIAWGTFLIVFGAAISYYTGMLLVHASNHTSRHRYEDIADALYGKKFARFTSIMNLLCLLAFIMSYIVYIKEAIPKIILIFAPTLDSFIVDPYWGQKFWGTIFSFFILFPMSLPRSINALRFSSAFGVLCSVYLCLAVTVIFWSDRTMVPDPWENFKEAEYFVFSFNGLVTSMPLIIFAYMYQVNIPLIYKELERRNAKTMGKVLIRGSTAAIVLYAMVGIFCYLTFVKEPWVITQNIFEAPYGSNVAIIVGQFTLFFAVMTAAPLCVLPAKDTVEELFYKKEGLSTKVNALVTLALVAICFLLSISIDKIGDAITLAGATINPVIGFIIPVMFYWKVRSDLPATSYQKVISLSVAIIIIIVSIMSLGNFIYLKIKS